MSAHEELGKLPVPVGDGVHHQFVLPEGIPCPVAAQRLPEQPVEVVHGDPPRPQLSDKHVVFETGTLGPHHVVEEQLVHVAGGQPRQLEPGPVDDDLAQLTDRSQIDPDSFRDLYSAKVNNPFNFGAPRTIRLGVRFDF